MKNQKWMLMLVGISVSLNPLPAQQPVPERKPDALELLRKTLGAPAPTNVPAARVIPANTPTNTPAAGEMTVFEIDRLYLDGKITARQYQKYLQERRDIRPPPSVPTNTAAAPAAAVTTPVTVAKPAPPKTGPDSRFQVPVLPSITASTNPPTSRANPGVNTNAQAKLTEVEVKMDELLRLKAAREKAGTNVTNTGQTAAGPPKTKRQRLDDLLKLLIDDKINQAEYDTRWKTIVAEPD